MRQRSSWRSRRPASRRALLQVATVKKIRIARGQLWEDIRTGRRGYIAGYQAGRGWVIVWLRGGQAASRHLTERALWKFHRPVEATNAGTDQTDPRRSEDRGGGSS